MITSQDYALFFLNDDILLQRENPFIKISQFLSDPKEALLEQDYFLMGKFNGKNLFAITLKSPVEEEPFKVISVRDTLHLLDRLTCQQICRGKQLLHWHHTSLYSGCCGTMAKLSEIEIAKICPTCNRIIYPRIYPVVIALVEKEGKILLGRSPHFPKGTYSALAGFIDPGESCEEAIQREIMEEVSIQVKEITYFGSQSWPFPTSLMLGFFAKYARGTLKIDPKEIEDAQWFNVSDLPTLPPKITIAREMIDCYSNSIF